VGTETRGHVCQRIGQRDDFKIIVDRLSAEEVELERFLVAVAKLREAFPIGFWPFVAGAEKATRIFEQRAVESTRCAIGSDGPPARLLEVVIDGQNFCSRILRFLDAIVSGEGALPLRVGLDLVAKFLFARFDRTPN